MISLLAILVRPREGLRLLKLRPRWVLPFVVLAVLQVLLLALTAHQGTQAVLAHLPPSATAPEREEVASFIAGGLGGDFLFDPIRRLLGWSAFAGLLFALVRLLAPPEPVRYTSLLALEVHAEAAPILGSLTAIAFAIAAGSGTEGGLFRFTLSPAALCSPDTPFLILALLRSSDIFTLWYVLILAKGIRVLCGLTFRTSALIAGGAWVLSTIVNLGILALLIHTLHLRV